MDKKKLIPNMPAEELKGFEEFIDSQDDTSFLSKPSIKKSDPSFEHYTFLASDHQRLEKTNQLISEKIIFQSKHSQHNEIIKRQQEELLQLSHRLAKSLSSLDSPFNQSLKIIFDNYFSA